MAQGKRRCHTPCRKKQKPAQTRRPKTIVSGRIRMFSANDSWLSNFIPGRSSDLAITALRRLPGNISSGNMAWGTRLTATSSCRTCTCFPFHPGAENRPGHRGRSIDLSIIISQHTSPCQIGCSVYAGNHHLPGLSAWETQWAEEARFFKKGFTKTEKTGIIFRNVLKRA